MIDYTPFVTLLAGVAIGGGLLWYFTLGYQRSPPPILWYFTLGSGSGKPDLGDSSADNSFTVVAAPGNTGQKQGQAGIVGNAFFKYAGSHAHRIGKYREDGDLDRYNWILGGKPEKNMRSFS